MRPTDTGRERVAALLRDGYARGCISVETLGHRVELAYGAKSVEQLAQLVEDLPARKPSVARLWRWLRTRHRRDHYYPALTVEMALPRGARNLTIGRSPDCDLVLGDPTVSRVHARLRRSEGRWHIVDLGSKNGTWLNGERVAEADVGRGDELILGGMRTRVI